MDGNERSLAAVPTDQLVLTLLRELASRVDRLESRDEAGEERTLPGASAFTKLNSFAQKLLNEEVSSGNGYTTPQEVIEESSEEEEPVHIVENRLVPYGYLLDSDDFSNPLKCPSDRLIDMSIRDPEVADLLRHLGGIAQVPADFRFELANFWTLDITVQKGLLGAAIEFLDTLKTKGGDYWVMDHDLKSNQVLYAYHSALETSLDVPLVSQHPWERKGKSAPWRRVILLQGVSEMSSHMRFGNLRRNGELVMTFQNPFFAAVSPTDAINTHLGKSFGQGTLLGFGGGYRFHLSWCRARRLPSHQARSRQGAEELKVGQLYGSSERYLCQEAYTIHAIADNHQYASAIDELTSASSAHFQRHWTILLLTPLGFYRRGLLKVPRVVSSPSRSTSISPLQINMLTLIEDALGAARRSWRGLHQYIEELLGTGTEIFDPELHDSLLSDDELFSGSRKYFWLINSLQTFDNILRQNCEAWMAYRDKFLLPLSRALEGEEGPAATWKGELDEGVALCDKLVEDLGRVQGLFRDQRERTLALREGLFSASAVIESRASTRLGENVKLLTYVSIFYLPLSFCTSLWSTSPQFSFSNLAITCTVLSLTTYILVFNLNSLVATTQSAYTRWKSRLVDEMVNDEREAWMRKGVRFERYKPRNAGRGGRGGDEKEPSEWWVLVYLFGRGLWGWSRRGGRGGNGGGTQEGTEGGVNFDGRDGVGADSGSEKATASDFGSSRRRWFWRFFEYQNKDRAESS